MMNLLSKQLSLDDFILAMLQVPIAKLQLDQLQDWVSRLTLKDDLFDRHITFKPDTYQRRLLCRTPRFDMLILCWQPGQQSSIHDHQESLNVTRVYRGQLTSRGFQAIDRSPSLSFTNQCSDPTASCSMPLHLCQEVQLEKSDLAVVDRHSIHQLANAADENLVTLHVYARPLQKLAVYCPQSGKSQLLPVHYSE